jgi:hypothetical protein
VNIALPVSMGVATFLLLVSVDQVYLQFFGGFLGVFIGAVFAEVISRAQRVMSANVALSQVVTELNHNLHQVKMLGQNFPRGSDPNDPQNWKLLKEKMQRMSESYGQYGFLNDSYVAFLSGQHAVNLLSSRKEVAEEAYNHIYQAYNNLAALRSVLSANALGISMTVMSLDDPRVFSDPNHKVVIGQSISRNLSRILDSVYVAEQTIQGAIECGIKYMKNTPIKYSTVLNPESPYSTE